MSDETNKAPGNATPEARQEVADPAPARTYAVGFGKPPAASRFKKGQSGNPTGRPKTADISDIAPLIEGIFSESVKMREGEQVRTLSNLEAMLRAQVTLALKGEPKAIRTVFNLGVKAGLFSKAQQKSFIEIVEPDGKAAKILRGYHAQKAGEFTKARPIGKRSEFTPRAPENNAEEMDRLP